MLGDGDEWGWVEMGGEYLGIVVIAVSEMERRAGHRRGVYRMEKRMNKGREGG